MPNPLHNEMPARWKKRNTCGSGSSAADSPHGPSPTSRTSSAAPPDLGSSASSRGDRATGTKRKGTLISPVGRTSRILFRSVAAESGRRLAIR
ncbi:MAG: hypothetical protein IPI48_10915 [bacterium]|nr:hypothetical protein [bacterium]